MQITVRDQKYLQSLHEAGVLKKNEGHKLATTNGAILVAGSDGEQFTNVYYHAMRMVMDQEGTQSIHPLINRGGAMLLSPRNLIDENHAPDAYVIAQIGEIAKKQEIGTVLLVVSATCPAAQDMDLSIVEVIDHMLRGKKRIKERWPHLKVACFVQVDDSKSKHLFFISRFDFGRWYEQFEEEVLGRLDNDMEDLDDLSASAARDAIKCRSDDAVINKIVPSDGDSQISDPSTDRLIRQMRISGEHTAVTAGDLRA